MEVMIRDSHASIKRSADSSLPAPHPASTTVLYLLQQAVQSFSAARKQAHKVHFMEGASAEEEKPAVRQANRNLEHLHGTPLI